ncbi:GntR family transcriptional regulator [Actinacidiphila glaucinigra]|uniref:GntR family transcriptional regulator n=1 Tax=Actinacidiphila glaucinigra TaxID=235986 RepID=UPI0037B991AD
MHGHTGQVARGDWEPNRAIPSEQRLVQEYGLARSTVRRAIAVLAADGLVFTVPQRGTFVTPPQQPQRKAPSPCPAPPPHTRPDARTWAHAHATALAPRPPAQALPPAGPSGIERSGTRRAGRSASSSPVGASGRGRRRTTGISD